MHLFFKVLYRKSLENLWKHHKHTFHWKMFEETPGKKKLKIFRTLDFLKKKSLSGIRARFYKRISREISEKNHEGIS